MWPQNWPTAAKIGRAWPILAPEDRGRAPLPMSGLEARLRSSQELFGPTLLDDFGVRRDRQGAFSRRSDPLPPMYRRCAAFVPLMHRARRHGRAAHAHLPTFGRVRTKLVQVGRRWTDAGQRSNNAGRRRPEIAQGSANVGRNCSANAGQNWPKVGQRWDKFATFGT